MALLHRSAEVIPSKLELMAAWLPARPWYRGPAQPDLRRVVSFRFDDPAGQVGVETFVVDPGDGGLLQVPLTYRPAPLDGADQYLVGTAEHTVLGPRWVYDGCGDPVYAAALADVMFTGGGQAEEMVEENGEVSRREPSCTVRGSGSTLQPRIEPVLAVAEADPTIIRTGDVELAVLRALADGLSTEDPVHLTATWPGRSAPLLLARARLI
jgi:maltokinase-like protein